MGLFDAFKKKVEEKSEEINPLYQMLQDADLSISDLQVNNQMGQVTVSGVVENGEVITMVNDMLTNSPGVQQVVNQLEIADVSDQGIKYKVHTKGSNLNARSGPGTSNEIIGKFPNGTEVTLVKRINNTWFIVRTDELDGHCHTDYLDLV